MDNSEDKKEQEVDMKESLSPSYKKVDRGIVARTHGPNL